MPQIFDNIESTSSPHCRMRRAIEEHRLIVLSILGSEVTHATRASALIRNEFIAALAVTVFVPHAAPGSQGELIAKRAIARGQVVLTLDDPENSNLFALGARPLIEA